MAARSFFISGVVILFCAFILSLIVAVSLPGLPGVDIARVHFTSGTAPHVATNTESIKEIRFGIWAYCIYDAETGHRTCIDPGYGYRVQLLSASNSITIGPGSTRGLAVHPVAAGVTFIALLFSCSSHFTLNLLASLISFVAALLTLIAFAIDIALYTIVHNKVRSVAAPGLWIVLASLILLLLAGCTVCLGQRRHSRMSRAIDYNTTEKPGLFSHFRRR
ncbi:hypothetical protein BGW80DRAFT_1249775 [Lactifluus volemus]|nr:hypothetical protein BGW80DRAFT_1249775 [Lactifluus volemus]